MLVDLHAGNAAKVDANAGIDHRVGQRGGFVGCHSAQNDRHQQRRRLIIGQRAVRDAVDEEADLVASQRTAVPLLHDHVNGAHLEIENSEFGIRNRDAIRS